MQKMPRLAAERQRCPPRRANDARDKWLYDLCGKLVALQQHCPRTCQKKKWEKIESVRGSTGREPIRHDDIAYRRFPSRSPAAYAPKRRNTAAVKSVHFLFNFHGAIDSAYQG